MTDDDIVELTVRMDALASCKSTIGGWLWYCWEHDTHGNADTEEEAKAISQAHLKHKLKVGGWSKKYADDCCDIAVIKVVTD